MIPTLSETVERMKREIAADRAAGKHRTAQSFGDLHDSVDANEYGGFCDDKLGDAFIVHFGGRDEHEGMPQAYLDHINSAQGEIGAWIVAGGLHTTTGDLT